MVLRGYPEGQYGMAGINPGSAKCKVTVLSTVLLVPITLFLNFNLALIIFVVSLLCLHLIHLFPNTKLEIIKCYRIPADFH